MNDSDNKKPGRENNTVKSQRKNLGELAVIDATANMLVIHFLLLGPES